MFVVGDAETKKKKKMRFHNIIQWSYVYCAKSSNSMQFVLKYKLRVSFHEGYSPTRFWWE